MMIFPEEKLARMNGILQSFTGFGMLIGPILGSLLFNLGGFQLPFYTVGVMLLLLALANHCVIPKTVDIMNMSVNTSMMSQSEDAQPLHNITRQDSSINAAD